MSISTQGFPPTPAPSDPSSSQQGSPAIIGSTSLYSTPSSFASSSKRVFYPSKANMERSLDRPLPPTPSSLDSEQSSAQIHVGRVPSAGLSFVEPEHHQRPRKGRRPASTYPAQDLLPSFAFPFRKATAPTNMTSESGSPKSPSDGSRPTLESNFDFGRYYDPEPTLSMVTTSTVESTTGTPSLNTYEFPQPEHKADLRLRSPYGRSDAYSSAESSVASSAYHYLHGELHQHHPHPVISSLAHRNELQPKPVGLGIATDHSPVNPVSARLVSDAAPWVDRATRRRTISASSYGGASNSVSGASVVDGSDSDYAAAYGKTLTMGDPYQPDGDLPTSPEALVSVEHGRQRVFDNAALDEMGGIDNLTDDTMYSLTGPSCRFDTAAVLTHAGITHLLLPAIGSRITLTLPSLLVAVCPALVVLDLSCNDLAFLPEVLSTCTGLEELNLKGNPLRVLPSWIGDLTALRVLVADECGLQSLCPETARLRRLHTLCGKSTMPPGVKASLMYQSAKIA